MFVQQIFLLVLLSLSTLWNSTIAYAGERYEGPIIDMHLHAMPADANGPPPIGMCVPLIPNLPAWDPAIESWGETFMRWSKSPTCERPLWSAATDEELIDQTVAAMVEHRVVGVLSGLPGTIEDWIPAAPERFIPSIELNIARDGARTPAQLRPMFESGKFQVLGEISNQYSGIAPNDSRMDPYWDLAEELDVPVAIHLGSGPPGAPYLGYPKMRISHGNALLLEDVLIKHPRLRLSIMHYGHHDLPATLALLEHHPQVYLDLGGIQWFNERAYFWSQLKQLVDAGHSKRIMFGSDQMVIPDLIGESINIVDEAPFLTTEQKSDIFYNNAARFLRLSDVERAAHQGL